jgi:hypothetical protein
MLNVVINMGYIYAWGVLMWGGEVVAGRFENWSELGIVIFAGKVWIMALVRDVRGKKR